MSELNINCPKCGHAFALTQALTGPLLETERRKTMLETEERLTHQAQHLADEAAKKARAESAATIASLQQQQATIQADLEKARTAELAAHNAKREADDAKRNVELEIVRRVTAQLNATTLQAREESAKDYQLELDTMRSQLATKDAKLTAAQEAELLARRAKQEADEAKREAELLVERRLDEERGKVREQALKERDDEYRLKLQEKDHQLFELKEKLDEAQRKADVGSPYIKGEVLEVDLHDLLADAFPTDIVERIKKGQKGGDVLQTVRNASGLVCGKIKWESKHTQNWSDAWLSKLREDQRAHKCDLAALVSDALPEDVEHFDFKEGVWVSGLSTALPMAAALRTGLIDTATARRAATGTDSSKDQAYQYLTGPEFRARVQGAVEPVAQMRNSLESEKRAAERQFAARDKQIQRVVLSLAGMYGDLQGLLGPSLPTVQGLALPEHAADALPPITPALLGDGADSAQAV
jgi:hypothetical protein